MDRIIRIRAYIIFLVSYILAGNLYAQIQDQDKNDYLDADYYFYIQEYDKALEHLLKIHPKYPTHGNINYLIGVCYILHEDNYKKAVPFLEAAVSDLSENYRPGDLKYSGAPPDALLYYGDALHGMGSFIKASKAYNEFLGKVSDDEISRTMVINRIIGLGMSYEAYVRSPKLRVTGLGKTFNTSENEFNPVFSANDEIMLYTSEKGTSYRIMYTTKINGEWATPVDITRELGSDGSYYTSSLSHDGGRLFLIKDDKTNKDIYESYYENGVWTRIQALDKKINSVYNETGASISKDGNILYFSSDKPGGYGGIDIYYSIMQKGKWGKPLNVEAPVNTSFDDDKPLISESNDTLFFSTNGRETIGKMDIFFAVKTSGGQWAELTNLGIPYNTVYNDYIGHYLYPGSGSFLAQKGSNQYSGLDIVSLEKIIQPPPVIAETQKPEPVVEESDVVEQEVIVEETQIAEEVSQVEAVSEDDAVHANIVEDKIEKDVSENLKAELIDNNTVKEHKPEQQVYRNFEAGKKETEPVRPKSYSKVARNNNIAPVRNVRYTIQLIALKEVSEKVEFRGLNMAHIKISRGNDGYTRYTYGQFETAGRAQQELIKVYGLGHDNAFIKDVSLISNY